MRAREIGPTDRIERSERGDERRGVAEAARVEESVDCRRQLGSDALDARPCGALVATAQTWGDLGDTGDDVTGVDVEQFVERAGVSEGGSSMSAQAVPEPEAETTVVVFAAYE